MSCSTMDNYSSDDLFENGPLQTSCSSEDSYSEPETDTTTSEKHFRIIKECFNNYPKQSEVPDKSRTITSTRTITPSQGPKRLKTTSSSGSSHMITPCGPGKSRITPYSNSSHVQEKSRTNTPTSTVTPLQGPKKSKTTPFGSSRMITPCGPGKSRITPYSSYSQVQEKSRTNTSTSTITPSQGPKKSRTTPSSGSLCMITPCGPEKSPSSSRVQEKSRTNQYSCVTTPSLENSYYKNCDEGGRRVDQYGESPNTFSSSSQIQEFQLATVLNELTGTMNKFISRLDKQERRMESIEKQLKSVTSGTSVCSSTDSCHQIKEKIPLGVRAEVRRMYQLLYNEDENFQGFDLAKGSSFKDEINIKVVERIIKEVQASNPSFQAGHIRAATYTYYRTLGQESSLERRGIQAKRKVARRRRERTNRKLSNRLSTLAKSPLSEKDKLKWKAVLIKEFMSSEESTSESEESSLLKRTLPWRSSKVTNFFYDLDQQTDASKSTQSKRQTKPRTLSGVESTRPIPVTKKLPSWAIVADGDK